MTNVLHRLGYKKNIINIIHIVERLLEFEYEHNNQANKLTK